MRPAAVPQSRGMLRALLLLLAAVGLGHTALPAAPPEGPMLERYDPGKKMSEAQKRQRIDLVRSGITAKQVRHLLGEPRRAGRQILYHRYFEQWVYDAPFYQRVEFECPQGQEPQVQSVREILVGPP